MGEFRIMSHKHFQDLMFHKTDYHWKRFIKRHHRSLDDGVEFVEEIRSSMPFVADFQTHPMSEEEQRQIVRKTVLLLHHALGDDLAIQLGSVGVTHALASLLHLTRVPQPLPEDHPFATADIARSVLINAIAELSRSYSPMDPMAGVIAIQNNLTLTADAHDYIRKYFENFWEGYVPPSVH